ncbi:MAG TPA: hypothetical protein ENH15_05395, partial [Actinobacteria bacterium]|nr:hypothetical protein [Actinomycetota bacterium]
SDSADRLVAVVSGWSGSTNLGDELLSLAVVQKLKARGVEPLLISTDPSMTAASLGVKSIGHTRWPAVTGAIRSASALIFGGGGLVQDVTSQLNLPYHLARPRIASALRTPFSGIGLGIGPLTTRPAKLMARRVLNKARAVGVRDEASADLARSLGINDVVLGADLALCLPVPDVRIQDRLVVSLRPPVRGGWSPVAGRRSELDDGWIAAAAKALDAAIAATGLSVHFVPLQTDRDDVVHRRVAERMRSPSSHASPTLGSVFDEIASGRVVIAMRYHAAIGALLGARPAVLLGYDPKVDALAAETGSGFALIGSASADFDRLPGAVSEVLGRAELVEEGRDRLRGRERANDRILDDLLGDPR